MMSTPVPFFFPATRGRTAYRAGPKSNLLTCRVHVVIGNVSRCVSYVLLSMFITALHSAVSLLDLVGGQGPGPPTKPLTFLQIYLHDSCVISYTDYNMIMITTINTQ